MSAIPAPYVNTLSGFVGGHYAVAQVSGAIAATPTALDPHASIRWAPASGTGNLVLMRLRVGLGCISANATAVRIAYQASIARGFTVDYVTGSTAINMSTVTRTNALSSGTMQNSQMGANGPRITTTGAMSGHTNTLDSAPFAIANWDILHSVTATGTAVQINAGSAAEMKTLYEWTSLAQHPVVLAPNEGVVVQLVHTGWAAGTYSLYTQWEWAEVATF